MMLKKIVLMTVILGLILGFSGLVLAEERIEFKEFRLTSVRQEKIDVLAYGAAGGSWLAEVVRRLIESGKPSVVFAEHVKGAVEVTFVEEFLGKNVDLIGGMTLRNEEPSNFVWGLQYTGLRAKEGGVWEIFSKLNPTIYNERGEWFVGVAYAWRD